MEFLKSLTMSFNIFSKTFTKFGNKKIFTNYKRQNKYTKSMSITVMKDINPLILKPFKNY